MNDKTNNGDEIGQQKKKVSDKFERDDDASSPLADQENQDRRNINAAAGSAVATAIY